MERQTITTTRLVLTPVTEQDTAALHQLWTNPEVRRYLFDDQTIALEQARDYVELSARLFAERGCGLWAIRLKDSTALAGFCGFLPDEEPPGLQLIYGLAPERWGQGLAREAALAVMRYGVQVCGLARILAGVDAPNLASVRLLEQLGLRLQRRSEVEGRELLFYAADAAELNVNHEP